MRNLLTNHEGHGQKDPGRRGRRRPEEPWAK